MPKKVNIPKPEESLKFIDVHCHLPFPRPRNNKLPSDEKQYKKFFEMGGKYLITCFFSFIHKSKPRMVFFQVQREAKFFSVELSNNYY